MGSCCLAFESKQPGPAGACTRYVVENHSLCHCAELSHSDATRDCEAEESDGTPLVIRSQVTKSYEFMHSEVTRGGSLTHSLWKRNILAALSSVTQAAKESQCLVSMKIA